MLKEREIQFKFSFFSLKYGSLIYSQFLFVDVFFFFKIFFDFSRGYLAGRRLASQPTIQF